MDGKEREAVERLTRALTELARERPAARQAMIAFGDLLHQIAHRAGDDGMHQSDRRAEAAAGPPGPRVRTPLRLGESELEVVVPGNAAEAIAAARARPIDNDDDRPQRETPRQARSAPSSLEHVERRAALKAEACRWAIERRAIVEDEGVDDTVKARDRELLDAARAMEDCFLWPLHPYAELPDDESLEQAAGNYESIAACVGMMRAIDDRAADHESVRDAMHILARAQSALRQALRDAGQTKDDADQDDVFQWLKEQTTIRQIFIRRHMKLADPADPSQWRDIIQDAADLLEDVNERSSRLEGIQQELNRLAYHVGRASEGDADDHDWKRIEESLESLLYTYGMPPSSPEIRRRVEPLLELDAEDLTLSDPLRLALREAERAGALTDDDRAADRDDDESTLSPEVADVASLLEGRRAVLIGGDRRGHAAEALQRAFNLTELEWVATSPHQPTSTFEPAIARNDTAVVMLAIRWASHSFEDAKQLCDKHGKPFVRLPAGYNPNQVAHQILEQVGRCLSESAGAAPV